MIVVLRLGHRRARDKRISTHVGLVARAFGAQKIIYSGEKDQKLLDSIKEAEIIKAQSSNQLELPCAFKNDLHKTPLFSSLSPDLL